MRNPSVKLEKLLQCIPSSDQGFTGILMFFRIYPKQFGPDLQERGNNVFIAFPDRADSDEFGL